MKPLQESETMLIPLKPDGRVSIIVCGHLSLASHMHQYTNYWPNRAFCQLTLTCSKLQIDPGQHY